jgi:diguanylate cyclase (GGDEF)-like protein
MRKNNQLEKFREACRKCTGLYMMPDLTFHINETGRFIEFIKHKELIQSIFPGELKGKNINDVLPTEEAETILKAVNRVLETGNFEHIELRLSIEDKDRFFEGILVLNGKDRVFGIVRDMTDFNSILSQVLDLAHNDSLTGLPNRYIFMDRLKLGLANAKRKKELLAILFLDIDNFKHINNTLGHQVGDKLLQIASERIANYVRKIDTVARLGIYELQSTVARHGGDEFTLLLADINDVAHIAKIADRISDIFKEPFYIEDHELYVTASIGISVYPEDSEDVDTLMKNAEIAMYHAKKHGKNNYKFFKSHLNAAIHKRFSIENKLWKALQLSEFCLFYQPQVAIKTSKTIGVEALIRWMQPDLVITKPSEFIPLAEETGIINNIGEWVLHTACEQNKKWQEQGLPSICVTVNISSVQFQQKDFTDKVRRALNYSKLQPQYLQLELTEGTLTQNIEDTIEKMKILKESGIRISIDDFGTGYSSLNYLRTFPVSTLKIDRSFINELGTEQNNESIIKAIIALAKNLDLQIIAEGVEKRKQLSFLQQHGCDAIQGYLVCPPLNVQGFEEFLRVKGEKAFLSGDKKI